MELICIDTDLLIDMLRGQKETVDKIKDIEGVFHLATTVINSFELYYGAFRTEKREKNVLYVDKLLERLLILKMKQESSKHAGKILADLEKKGEIIDFRDVLIASIAITTDTTLFTRNISHFERIEGIKLYE